MDKQSNHTPDNDKLRASEQQLKAINQQLRAANQQLQASQQQLKAANQQLGASNQQLRAAEKELRKSRRRYKTMFDSTINAIAVYEVVDNGNDFVFRDFNPSAERIEKIKKGDLLGKSVLEVLPGVEEFGLFDVFQGVWKSGKAEHYSETIHKDGRITGWRENYVFKLPSGEVVAVYEDITERKRAEEVLAEEHNLLRSLIDNLPDSIYIKDTRSRFVIGNIEVAHRVGVTSPDEFIGKTDHDFYPEELASKYYADEQEVIRSGRPLVSREEQVVNQTTGETIWNLTTKVPWRDSHGKIVGVMGIGRNITERKQAEEALEAANQQLQASEQQLRAANQQLEAANQQLRSNEQQFKATNQQLNATNQQLRASEQQLKAAHQQLQASEQQLKAANQQLEAANQQLRASEKQLREEREKAQKYLDVAGTMMVVIDPDQKVTLINKRGCEILGYKQEEILGRNWFDNFVPKSVREKMRAVFQQSMAGEIQLIEYNERPVLTKSGQERIIVWHNAILTDEDGNVVDLLASGTDITERKRAEEKLARSEAIYRKTVENAGGVPYQVRLSDGRYDFMGPGIEKLVGIAAEKLTQEIFNGLIKEMIPADPSAPRDMAAYHETVASGKRSRHQVDLRIRTPNGEVKWLSDSSFPVRDEKTGEIVFSMGIAQDITERKKAEKKLLDYQKQLKSLASELSLTEERERRRIATELHDRISQSLVISKVKLELLRESAPSGDFARALGEVCSSLDQTIRNTRLLTFDLSSPILYELGFEAAVAEWLTEQIQEKYGIESEFEDDGQPKPLGDDIRVLLFRDVRELLINVVKHAHAHKVKVSIRRVGSEIRVSVEDDGVGFDLAEVASIAAQTGGFGLFSIRERLEQLGGHLELESKLGHGTRVTIMAPLKEGKINDGGQE